MHFLALIFLHKVHIDGNGNSNSGIGENKNSVVMVMDGNDFTEMGVLETVKVHPTHLCSIHNRTQIC